MAIVGFLFLSIVFLKIGPNSNDNSRLPLCISTEEIHQVLEEIYNTRRSPDLGKAGFVLASGAVL